MKKPYKYFENNKQTQNARISINASEAIIKDTLNIELFKVSQSPYSNSLYFEFFDIRNDNNCYSIRVSDHFCFQLPDNCILDIETDDNGNFAINKIHIGEMQEMIKILTIKNYKKDVSSFLKRVKEAIFQIKEYGCDEYESETVLKYANMFL